MGIWRLVFGEILHRKLNFALGLLSVVVAVGCLVGALTLPHAYDARTDQIVAQKEAEAEEKMRKMEDDYRKIMKKMGFNVLILAKGRAGEFWAKDFASKCMPEEYVDKLANSRIMTARRLLPSLQQKVDWPERRCTIVPVGARGEVPLMHRDPRTPMIEPAPAGSMAVGYEVHSDVWSDPAAWAERGSVWEAVTATDCLQASADILVMRHPRAVETVRKAVAPLTGGSGDG